MRDPRARNLAQTRKQDHNRRALRAMCDGIKVMAEWGMGNQKWRTDLILGINNRPGTHSPRGSSLGRYSFQVYVSSIRVLR